MFFVVLIWLIRFRVTVFAVRHSGPGDQAKKQKTGNTKTDKNIQTTQLLNVL